MLSLDEAQMTSSSGRRNVRARAGVVSGMYVGAAVFVAGQLQPDRAPPVARPVCVPEAVGLFDHTIEQDSITGADDDGANDGDTVLPEHRATFEVCSNGADAHSRSWRIPVHSVRVACV